MRGRRPSPLGDLSPLTFADDFPSERVAAATGAVAVAVAAVVAVVPKLVSCRWAVPAAREARFFSFCN